MVYVVGICGGSGSGKTTLAKKIIENISDSSYLSQDSYYKDYSVLFDFDGGKINFDHPKSLDFDLMAQHLKKLRNNLKVDVPCYDFVTHSRTKQKQSITPKRIIVVDGILILSQKLIRPLLDLKIFIDCPEKLRYERRLKRDVVERGRSREGVTSQFYKQVKPMHDLYVEPSQKYANIKITLDNFDDRLKKIVAKLNKYDIK